MKTEKYLLNMPSWLILTLFLIGGGVLSMILCYEMSWDFANYHFFGPWAFFNDRIGYDVAAAGFNAFYNPFMDVPLYLLIKYFNNYPYVIHFMQGLWSGLLMYILFKIALLSFDYKTIRGKFGVILAMLVGLTGNAFFMQIGTSSNDIQTSALVMVSFYMLLKEISKENMRGWIFLLAGFIMGAAMGLKLTAVTYCLASGLSLILFYKSFSNPVKVIGLFALGGLLGFFAFHGYWMYLMWEKIGNPLFPFGNAVFKSPFGEFGDNSYLMFRPLSFWAFLIKPFVMCFGFFRLEGMAWSVDFRLAIIYVIAIIYAVRLLAKRIQKQSLDISRQQKFLMLFLLLSYLIWVNLFALMRFYVPIEVLSAIYIIMALLYIRPKSLIGEATYYTFVVILIFTMVSTPYFTDYWGKKHYSEGWDKYVQIEDINIPDNTLILSYNYPTAMFAPYFSEFKGVKGLRIVSVLQEMYLLANPNDKSLADYFNVNPYWLAMKKDVIDKHKGPVFALVNEAKDPNFQVNKDSPLIKDLKCRPIRNSLVPAWMLCVPPALELPVFGNIQTTEEAIKKMTDGK